MTIGQRMADRLASLAGSWAFILSFAGILLCWILINTISLLRQPFDPYPYILLNLVLSCLGSNNAKIKFNLDEANRMTVSPEYYRGSGLVGCHRFGWIFFRPRPGNCLRAPQADRTLGHDRDGSVRRNYMAGLCKAFRRKLHRFANRSRYRCNALRQEQPVTKPAQVRQ